MSILNHFGKVKTTFIPYKNKHYEDKNPKSNVRHNMTSRGGHAFSISNNAWSWSWCTSQWGNSTPQIPNKEHQEFVRNFYEKQFPTSDLLHGVEDFANIVRGIVTDITSPIWNEVSMSPKIKLEQLICIKVDDVDNRVDHLEKMLAQVIEDNKLLQRKVSALEQQKHIQDLRKRSTKEHNLLD